MLKENPIISMSRVKKSFENGTIAVKDMTIDLFEGEFISFLGPSGCGKSTVLKMVSGLLRPTAGKIHIKGHDVSASGSTQDVGFVFQDSTLMPWATVQDNVYLPLRLKGITRKDASQEIDDILYKVGLQDFKKSYPRELSGGMKMRVSIARALITKPKLLLMDEPFAALDEITRFKLNNDVLKFWDDTNLTVIFVTHSVFESVYLSSRVVVMAPRPGRVIADIPLSEHYPRSDEYRTTSAYAKNCRAVSEYLKGATEQREKL